MNLKWPLTLVLLAFFLFGLAAPVQADGIIIPPPCPADRCPPPPPCTVRICPPPIRTMEQLDIRYHHVTVTIQDQLAVTHVDQVFHNPNSWAVEGTYVFPLPLDAAVTNFTLWVDGEPVQGEVMNADEARQYYEETVRNLKDPALLEYQGRGAVKASIFPIPPDGERRIELEYSQALQAENGLVKYVYPLNTEKFSVQPLEDVSVQVNIKDQQAIRAVYSPSHQVALDQKDEHNVAVGYEEKNVKPDSDFTLYYSLGDTQAFHLLTYRNPGDTSDPDGFFLLMLAPKPGVNQNRVAKDVLLVLDRSGSMEGEKFQQAQSALRYILKKLNPEDRFFLETFSTGIETYADGLRPASDVSDALAWVDGLNAQGSTDINRALMEAAAVADRERPTYLIFLTDGLPTQGVLETQQILDNFARTASSNLRLFAFGVGYDVDTTLLDSLSQEHHGQSTYVRPDENLDETLSAFYERISTPVLTDLKLDFGSLATYDIYPNPLPDLFANSQVIVTGRYRQGGSVDVTLKGQVNGETQTFRYPEQVFSADTRTSTGNLDVLPRLWATRKIGYLLNKVRLDGADKETIQQIINLSVRYGIVTPYTSYLVKEPMPLGAEAQSKVADQAYGQAAGAPAASNGKAAVDRAAQEGQMQSAQSVPQAPGAASGAGGNGASGNDAGSGEQTAVRVVGSRTYVYQSGVWVDTTYDPQVMKAQSISFLSDAYFRLLGARPDLAAALALGDQVTLVVDGQAYQVVKDGQSSGPVNLPQSLPTAATAATPQPRSTSNAVSAATAVPGSTEVAQPTLPPANGLAAQPAKQGSRTCAAGLLPLLGLLVFVWLKRR